MIKLPTKKLLLHLHNHDEKELYYSIPVMGPADFDFNDYKKELNKFPPHKGIFTTSLNYINN